MKRTYTDILAGTNDNYRAGWHDADRGQQHLPVTIRQNDGSQEYKDYLKGYNDCNRRWVMQQEAT